GGDRAVQTSGALPLALCLRELHDVSEREHGKSAVANFAAEAEAPRDVLLRGSELSPVAGKPAETAERDRHTSHVPKRPVHLQRILEVAVRRRQVSLLFGNFAEVAHLYCSARQVPQCTAEP